MKVGMPGLDFFVARIPPPQKVLQFSFFIAGSLRTGALLAAAVFTASGSLKF